MKPRELTQEGFKEEVRTLCGRVVNLSYDDAAKVTGLEVSTLYNKVYNGELNKQGNSRPARFTWLDLFEYMNKRGLIPA